jgi:hypothetical protein
MRIGAVIKDHYQVISELGYGTNPTVWLCHDLKYALLPSKYECPILIIFDSGKESGYIGC